jgi:hypothetical protein
MKRTVITLSLIFALAIALSASIPTLAAPGSATDTTVITGNIRANIEITAHPADFSLTNMDPGVIKESSPLTVTVHSNKAGWTLDVAETGGAVDGKMQSTLTPFTALTNPLMVKGGDLGVLPADYESITGTPRLVTSGGKGTISTTDIQFAQTADWLDDAALAYTISVIFTATN